VEAAVDLQLDPIAFFVLTKRAAFAATLIGAGSAENLFGRAVRRVVWPAASPAFPIKKAA